VAAIQFEKSEAARENVGWIVGDPDFTLEGDLDGVMDGFLVGNLVGDVVGPTAKAPHPLSLSLSLSLSLCFFLSGSLGRQGCRASLDSGCGRT
jgi:hypothetical protein